MFRATFLLIAIALNSGHLAQASDLQSKLGAVHFPTSGSMKVQHHFIRGIAALHSFWYTEALKAFEQSIVIDPDFAMGYWGLAMAHNHPLWEDQDKKSAKEALAKISGSSKLTQRERDYIRAARLLFGDGEKRMRDKAYSRAMKNIYHKYPDDLEAACFYSLSILGVSINTTDKLRLQVEAGSIALDVFQKNPNHPCAAHYAIHAFDSPKLARLALPSAKRYAKIAPASHHAQHMPAHIFVQLGMWSEAVTSNINGWHTSVEWVKKQNLPLSERDYHSLHWLHYSYLQQGRLKKAESIFNIQQQDMRNGINSKSNFRAGKYYHRMLSASVIETEQWELIEKFPPPEGWQPKIFSKAAYHFILGFSAANQGKIEIAEEHLSYLRALREKGFRENYFKRIENLEVWELEIQAAIKLYQKDFETAIKLAKKATLIEEKLPAPSGPPRILKPSYELLGEVYLKANKPVQAQEKFYISLLRHPNRIRSLVGIARASNANRNRETAIESYQQLVHQLKNASAELPELKEARKFLKGK